MAGERKLTVILAGDHKGLSNTLSGAGRDVDGFGSKIGKFGKAAAIGLGAVAVGAGVMAKGFIDAAIESQKITKQTDAVLKSMGNQAGVTSGQVAKLSESLSMQTGVDDELIQSGQNVLLTFGKVQNKAGKGNDIFNRATKSALDMSVALGTDLKGANIQLGKALNDPIKGITALGRAGVSFSEDQKKAIKAMVATGDTLGAQKIILGEMEKQFGGSAAAQATAGEKLQVIWGNLQEKLGGALLPIVEKVAGFLAVKLPKAFDAVGRAVGPFFKALRTGFTEDEGTPLENFALKVREVGLKVAEFMPKVISTFQAVVAWVQTNWPKIQEVIGQVMSTVAAIVKGVVDVITVLWNNFGNNILTFVQRVWPAIAQVIEGALNIIQGVIKTITALIHGDWSMVWEGIKQTVGGVWNAIQGIIRTALEVVRGIVGIAMEVVGSVIKGAWNGIVDFFKGIPGKIGAAFSGIANIIKAPYVAAFRAIKSMWNSTVGGFGFKVPGWVPGIGGKGFSIPNMHTGGIVPGGLSNEPLTRLQGGEGVFTRDQMDALGMRLRDREPARNSGPTTLNVYLPDGTKLASWLVDQIDELGKDRGVRYLGA